MVRLSLSSSCVTLALISSIGCSFGDGSRTGVVVFEDGEPVRSGSIELRSMSTRDRYSGRIESDGSFVLRDAQGRLGCPPDSYQAVVVQIVLTEDLSAEDHRHGRTVPRRFADYATSQIRVDTRGAPSEPLRVVLPDEANVKP